jgi:hypothetical protein
MEKGYLISKNLLTKIRRDNKLVNAGGPAPRNIGQQQHSRFLAKITAKKLTSADPPSAVYEAEQIVFDSLGYPQTITDGHEWGTTSSFSFGAIVDLQSTSTVNAYDMDDELHRIPLGSIVEVFYYGTSAGDNMWYTMGPTTESFWAKLTTDTSPYDWVRLRDDAVTETTITGTANATEVSGRDGIPIDSILRMFPKADNDASTGEYLFEYHGAQKGSASEFDISYTGEHQEAARTGVAWDRAAQGADRGVKLTVQVGTAFYDAGDMTLYAYMQDLTFDANGHLILISEETRVEIEVPEECICYY